MPNMCKAGRVLIASAILTVAISAHAQQRVFCEAAFTVAAHASKDCVIVVPAKMEGAKIEGHFRATGGPHNSIEVWVLDDDAFINWQNHHRLNALYNSQRVTQGTVNVPLPHPGKYHVVFNNAFSVLTPKAIESQFVLEHAHVVETSN
jgi:hypothetical protein